MFYLVKDGALFYSKSGLGALPLALFNGVALSSDEMDPDELEAIILQRIMDTTSTFQRAVFTVLLSMQKVTFQSVNCSETQERVFPYGLVILLIPRSGVTWTAGSVD